MEEFLSTLRLVNALVCVALLLLLALSFPLVRKYVEVNLPSGPMYVMRTMLASYVAFLATGAYGSFEKWSEGAPPGSAVPVLSAALFLGGVAVVRLWVTLIRARRRDHRR